MVDNHDHAPDQGPGHANHLPVTVVVSRLPRPGREADLVAWGHGISATASRFPGHLGATVYPPDPPDREDLVIAFSFATAAELSAWETSPERDEWIEKGRPLIAGPQHAYDYTGFEGIFSPNVHAPRKPPPRWKTATIIGLALFPVSLLLSWLLVPRLMDLNVVLRVLITTALIVPYMTWVGVPYLSRWLHGWLNPESRT